MNVILIQVQVEDKQDTLVPVLGTHHQGHILFKIKQRNKIGIPKIIIRAERRALGVSWSQQRHGEKGRI